MFQQDIDIIKKDFEARAVSVAGLVLVLVEAEENPFEPGRYLCDQTRKSMYVKR